MRVDTRALPAAGPARHLGRPVATTPPRQPHPPATPDGGASTARPPAGVVVISGWVAHWVALTEAKLLGLRWKG
ncbi:MAG TPA: hypothetical protein VJT72_15860 [Pseudonocardiaceae bacterium]|nr:hypothetical protein [Pseudonocardiaceae bacterium]